MSNIFDSLQAVAKQRKTINFDSREEAEALYKRRVEERTQAWERNLFPHVLAALAEGLSRAEIGRAYGSSDYNTIRRLIMRAEDWDAQGRPSATSPNLLVDTRTANLSSDPTTSSTQNDPSPLPTPPEGETPEQEEYESRGKIEFGYESDGQAYVSFGDEFGNIPIKPFGPDSVYIPDRKAGEDMDDFAERKHQIRAAWPEFTQVIREWNGEATI